MKIAPLFAAAALILTLQTSHAITLLQVDDFENGTTDSWANGGSSQPLNITTGGPAGVNDNFLKITADGSGSLGRLTIFNRSQWIGDYVAAGVNEIDMDLENLGSVTLNIRLAFKSSTAGQTTPGYLSSAFSLPADSTWHHATFSITAANMIAFNSPAVFSTFMTNPAELRIINESGTSNLVGDPVVSQLGVDNIKAVPEPTAVAFLVGGFGALASWGVLRFARTH